MQLGLPFAGAHDPPPGESPYFVRHRRARRYLLRVEPDGRVRVTIPRTGSRRAAEAFVARHAAWVLAQRARLSGTVVRDMDRARLRQEATASLPPRLLKLAETHGITVTRVSVRDQRTRWGSCSTAGRVCLNWRLVLMPGWVADYVMIHELMHVRRMDHSPRFWMLVAVACPDYRAARQWLRAHGPTLR